MTFRIQSNWTVPILEVGIVFIAEPFSLKTQAFVTLSERNVTPESTLQLYSVPKPDREPVKILIIGSQVAVNTIIYSHHHHRFAEPYSPRGMR
ncbi:hypothetical protein U2F10_19760 [Leptothoe sp. EHU-05/26/07-4]